MGRVLRIGTWRGGDGEGERGERKERRWEREVDLGI
jgi:hypothetical protein